MRNGTRIESHNSVPERTCETRVVRLKSSMCCGRKTQCTRAAALSVSGLRSASLDDTASTAYKFDLLRERSEALKCRGQMARLLLRFECNLASGKSFMHLRIISCSGSRDPLPYGIRIAVAMSPVKPISGQSR